MTKLNSSIKITARIPKLLHEYLINHAEKNNISINKYCNFLLSMILAILSNHLEI